MTHQREWSCHNINSNVQIRTRSYLFFFVDRNFQCHSVFVVLVVVSLCFLSSIALLLGIFEETNSVFGWEQSVLILYKSIPNEIRTKIVLYLWNSSKIMINILLIGLFIECWMLEDQFERMWMNDIQDFELTSNALIFLPTNPNQNSNGSSVDRLQKFERGHFHWEKRIFWSRVRQVTDQSVGDWTLEL